MLPFAVTIFLSAFLLFLVQPLIAKYILPWFGGGSGVWTTCLLFFQTLLLVGYAYAHALVRWLGWRAQGAVHLALVIAALVALPIVPSESWRQSDTGDPSWRILGLLSVCIGLPYLALSATGPLMQAWFARSNPGRSPYRLYALSNAGSLLALLAYPLVVEPNITRWTQAMSWSWGFALYAAGAAWCAVYFWQRGRRGEHSSLDHLTGSAPSQADSIPVAATGDLSAGRIALWVLLPACASILLMSFTTRLTEEVAPMPLLWIVPLAMYLLSFIICFEWPRLYHRPTFIVLLLVSFWIVAAIMILEARVWIVLQVIGFMIALFTCCMVCHGEAYRLRPPAARLTAFYLAIAAGGALGGACVVLLAPRLFNFQAEFYLALFGTFGLLLASMMCDRTSKFYRGAASAGWLGLILVTLTAACAMAYQANHDLRYTVLQKRNFFGTLRVDDRPGPPDRGNALFLLHGRITHGAQIMSPEFLRWPTTYFGPASGCGLVIQHFPKSGPRRVGVVGLGVGTLATYGRAGDVFRFYEINPAVVELADHPFKYRASSPADVEVVLGDARLSMEREQPQNYDILVLDAYSGDSIPLHLLTLEAFRIYDRHLALRGVILAHVSNAHLQLHKALLPIADQMHMDIAVVDSRADTHNLQNQSKWVIMTRNQQVLNHPEIRIVSDRPTPQTRRVDLWTDERVNLLQIMKMPRSK